jgi:hypothetical protein
MGGLGWHNPLPFEIGGGETDHERVWRALRSLVGQGGPGPEDSLEDLWRQCKAVALAADVIDPERAFLQGVPGKQTSHIDVYEDLLFIPRAPTDAQRAIAVRDAITLQLKAQLPFIDEALKRIDPRFAVDDIPWAQSATTELGRAFGPRVGGPAYGSGVSAARTATAWPNYADPFVLYVNYALAPGSTEPNERSLDAAGRLLNNVLPAWCDWSISTGDGDGFFLDGGPDDDSLLDQTAFD